MAVAGRSSSPPLVSTMAGGALLVAGGHVVSAG